jgi:hypothetical protein
MLRKSKFKDQETCWTEVGGNIITHLNNSKTDSLHKVNKLGGEGVCGCVHNCICLCARYNTEISE